MPTSSKKLTLSDWGELRFLEWVRRTVDPPGPEVPIGIGDDAALIRLARGRNLVITTDALIESVHFRHEWISPRDLGHKSLAVNLSDLAAKAARPIGAFLSLGVPPQTDLNELKSFFLGVRAEGRKWGCPLIGGDLVRAPQWVINIMAVGAPMRADGTIPRRNGLKTGMKIYVTGSPGESAAGLEALRSGLKNEKGSAARLIRRHRRPTPRLREAELLARACRDLVMIDVSDGIMNEARHLANESNVGIELITDALPISVALQQFGKRIKQSPARWVIYGGEDYELMFATAMPTDKIPIAASHIANCKKVKGVRLTGAFKNLLKNENAAFRHF